MKGQQKTGADEPALGGYQKSICFQTARDIDLQSHSSTGWTGRIIKNWLREREKHVNKIKGRSRKEEASRAARAGAMGVYLMLCISDLEGGAII